MRTIVLFLATTGCGLSSAGNDPSDQPFTQDMGAIALNGQLTWQIDFDEASGLQDCSYRRNYSGHQDVSAPWLCLACDNVYRVSVDMPLRDRACYSLISGEPQSVEWLGFSDREFFRGGLENYQLSPQGDASHSGNDVTTRSVTDWYDLDDGSGQFQLTVTGELTIGDEVTQGQDPWWGYRTPAEYQCGWSKSSQPAYDGDWTIREGQTVPDGWFHDACGEVVRLHDLAAGKYTLVDISAIDCPPCRDMAADEHAWIAQMRSDGYDVEVVTLLAPSLGDVLGTTATSQLNAWTDAFGLQSPVLADRGWGLWVVSEADPDFAYPSVVLVGPDLRVMQVDIGWGGFGRYTSMIQADAG